MAVIEDMEPQWSDLSNRAFRVPHGRRGSMSLAGQRLLGAMSGRPWQVQTDHLRIREADLQQWSAWRLHQTDCRWVGRYLMYGFQKSHHPTRQS